MSKLGPSKHERTSVGEWVGTHIKPSYERTTAAQTVPGTIRMGTYRRQKARYRLDGAGCSDGENRAIRIGRLCSGEAGQFPRVKHRKSTPKRGESAVKSVGGRHDIARRMEMSRRLVGVEAARNKKGLGLTEGPANSEPGATAKSCFGKCHAERVERIEETWETRETGGDLVKQHAKVMRAEPGARNFFNECVLHMKKK